MSDVITCCDSASSSGRPFCDFLVHQRGLGHPQRAEAHGLLRAHGVGDVLTDSVDEGHVFDQLQLELMARTLSTPDHGLIDKRTPPRPEREKNGPASRATATARGRPTRRPGDRGACGREERERGDRRQVVAHVDWREDAEHEEEPAGQEPAGGGQAGAIARARRQRSAAPHAASASAGTPKYSCR